MSKFKVGDYVIGNSNHYGITKKGWIGKVTQIYDSGHFAAKGKDTKYGGEKRFVGLDPKHFDLYTKDQPTKIVITTDGKTTTAKMYRDKTVIGVQTTKCHPDDRFDFLVGARIAFDRLVGEKKEEPEVISVKGFKVGDRVNCKGHNATIICISDDYQRGGCCIGIEYDEPNIGDMHRCGGFVLAAGTTGKTDNCEWCFASELKHGELPTYYNGKVVCVDNSWASAYTKGKIYQIVNGRITNDADVKLPDDEPVKSFKEWQRWSKATWLEVVE